MKNKCEDYLNRLCREIQQRPVGSTGNQQANAFFQEIVEKFGWKVESTPFKALDWRSDGAELQIGPEYFQVYPSPYSTGCSLNAELVAAGTLTELENCFASGKLLLLHDELAREQLMPKNFVFYNPEEHQRIITLLEEKEPGAILAATSRNAALAGGVYPFPLIEDGDFQIPSVFLTEEEGQKLLSQAGKWGTLVSRARRSAAESVTLVARKGQDQARRIAISAHIDAKLNTPGAIDNATGVIVLLLLAEKLKDYQGEMMIELLPFNGEDYYAASGQMIYLQQNQGHFDEIMININIDGAGYHQGPSAFSPFNLGGEEQECLDQVLAVADDIDAGGPWYQGDHSIFIQQGVPALAVTSRWFLENIDNQDITHTPKDQPGIVNCQRLVEISGAIHQFIHKAYLA
jgi:aminopeptidase YwaD